MLDQQQHTVPWNTAVPNLFFFLFCIRLFHYQYVNLFPVWLLRTHIKIFGTLQTKEGSYSQLKNRPPPHTRTHKHNLYSLQAKSAFPSSMETVALGSSPFLSFSRWLGCGNRSSGGVIVRVYPSAAGQTSSHPWCNLRHR